MSKVIRVSDSIFKRLQALATPFVYTPASVVEKLLDYHDNQKFPLKMFLNKII